MKTKERAAHQDQVDLVFPFAFFKLESVPSDLGEKLIITGTWQLQSHVNQPRLKTTVISITHIAYKSAKTKKTIVISITHETLLRPW